MLQSLNVSRTIDSLAKELGITPRTVYRYIDNPANAANIEALNDAIKHKK